MANDGLAELVRQYPDRFIGFIASLPMNNPEESLREMERAVDGLGAMGIQIFTNVAGKPLDSPEFAALFDEAARRDLGVWIHPARGAEVSDYPFYRRSRSTKSGGRWAGRMKPALPCHDWFSRAYSTGIRI